MQLIPRVKFQSSIDETGAIIDGDPVVGFQGPPLAQGYQYLLEDGTGHWELGYQPPFGVERQPFSNSGGTFPVSSADLTCSVIVMPQMLVDVGPSSIGSMPEMQKAEGVDSVAVGGYALVRTGSTQSTAVGQGAFVNVDSPYCVALGSSTQVVAPKQTAVGANAFVDGQAPGGSALGYYSYSVNAGEVSLGNSRVPHTAIIPLVIEDASAGGTIEFSAMTDADSFTDYFRSLSAVQGSDSSGTWAFDYVAEGVFNLSSTDGANNKVVKASWASIGYPSFVNSTITQTTLYTGANNVTFNIGINESNGTPTATVVANSGWKIRGSLTVTRFPRRM